MGYKGCIHTCVVDEGVEMSRTGFDLRESLLDRLVTGDIDLDRLDGVGRLGTFLAEGVDGKLGFFQRTTTEKNAVGFFRLQQRLDGLVADAIVAAGDENSLWGRHCYCSLRFCLL